MADEARRKPIEDVSEISAITYGFMASKALFAALEFDLFTHIAQGAAETRELSEATGIAENRLTALLAALKSLGLISEADGRLANAPATARYLVAGAPGDFRDYVRFVNGEFGYESFRHLGAALRGERIFPDKGFYEGMIYDAGIGGERFSSAQHSGSLGPARLLAKRLDLKRLAASSWTWAAAAGPTASHSAPPIRTSRRQFSISPRPWIRPNVMRGRRVSPTASRISPAMRSPSTGRSGHDMVLMSYVWSAVGEADIAILAKRAADALPPGGLALIHDFMVDDAREGPRFAAWYLLGSIFDNPTAVCLTPGLRRAGLARRRIDGRRHGDDAARDYDADQGEKARLSESGLS